MSISKSQTYVVLSIIALGVMVFAAGFDLMFSTQKLSLKEVKAQEHARRTAYQSIEAANADLKTARAKVAEYIWTTSPDLIGPTALSAVTNLAKKHQLKLTAFRPQRTNTDAQLLRLPYTISLEGSYPNVVSFLSDLETPTNKLAVNLFQVASAEGANDQVAATIGVAAFTPITNVKPITIPKSALTPIGAANEKTANHK